MNKKTNTTEEAITQEVVMPLSHAGSDLKNSVLIVSVLVNLVVFTGWILLQLTSRYDASLAMFLLGR